MLIRSAERFRSEHNGIVSLHCFSAGAFYDPDRLGVGALVAVDEHLIAPGAGFADHAHRQVDIVSLVVSGTLRHAGAGTRLDVPAGGLLVQTCGAGIRHAETNASDREPLRLLQMTLTGEAGDDAVDRVTPPVDVAGGRLHLLASGSRPVDAQSFVHVVAGTATVGDVELMAGDSTTPHGSTVLSAHGQVVLWSLRSDAAADRCGVEPAAASAARSGRTPA